MRELRRDDRVYLIHSVRPWPTRPSVRSAYRPGTPCSPGVPGLFFVGSRGRFAVSGSCPGVGVARPPTGLLRTSCHQPLLTQPVSGVRATPPPCHPHIANEIPAIRSPREYRLLPIR